LASLSAIFPPARAFKPDSPLLSISLRFSSPSDHITFCGLTFLRSSASHAEKADAIFIGDKSHLQNAKPAQSSLEHKE
jgi:hypothetical protein